MLRTAWLTAITLTVTLASPGMAQQPPVEPTPFFAPGKRLDKPDMAGIRAIRFVTDDDYPPFHFPGPDGQLTGFNVDLARAICTELKVACTIQARRWDTLAPSLEDGRADAVIASMVSTPELRRKFELSDPYYRTPARFVVRQGSALPDTDPASLKGRTIAAVRGTAHAAFLKDYYAATGISEVADLEEALGRLERGEADAVFADGVALSLWLNGPTGARCCGFIGGPYLESRYFGEGAVMAFRRDNAPLRRAVDYAVQRLAINGTYQALLLKYFPVAFY